MQNDTTMGKIKIKSFIPLNCQSWRNGEVFYSPLAAFLGKTLAAATEQTESVANSLLLAFVSLSDLLLFLIIGKGIGRLFAIIGPYRNQREANVA